MMNMMRRRVPSPIKTAEMSCKRNVTREVHTPHATKCPQCGAIGFSIRRSSSIDNDGNRCVNGGVFYACDAGCGATLNRNCDRFTRTDKPKIVKK